MERIHFSRRAIFPFSLAVAATGWRAPGAIAASTPASPAAPAHGFAPVPAGARGPAIPAAGYLVEEIRDGLYWVTDGVYQSIFLTTGEGVIAVDAPPSIGPNLLKAIADVTKERVTHLVYSHAHADHIGAASLFPGPVQIVAHEETARLLARRGDPHRPAPAETFSDRYTLSVGRQTLDLRYHGNNHEPGNIFIFAPAQKVLMVVDIVFPGWVPFKALADAQDVPGYIAAHDAILAYDFDTFVGGHVTRPGTRDDAETARAYVLDLKAKGAQALQSVSFAAVAQRAGTDNPWVIADAYLDAVARACTDAMLPGWTGRLGGADVFTYSNAAAMLDSLRGD